MEGWRRPRRSFFLRAAAMQPEPEPEPEPEREPLPSAPPASEVEAVVYAEQVSLRTHRAIPRACEGCARRPTLTCLGAAAGRRGREGGVAAAGPLARRRGGRSAALAGRRQGRLEQLEQQRQQR